MEPDAGFRPWATDCLPPASSVPPAVAGKVAQSLGDDAFRRYHLALMRAYFADNRTISDLSVQLNVAEEAGLRVDEFATRLAEREADLAAQVVSEHNEAIELGIGAVPAVVVDGRFAITGAMELERYRKVIERSLS